MKTFKYLLSAISISMVVFSSCEKSISPPKADFTISSASTKVNEEIIFSKQSQNSTVYNWDFGDGSNSHEENPSHIYTKSGSFTITLGVEGEGGTDTKMQTISVFKPDPKWLAYDDNTYENYLQAQSKYFYFDVLFDKPLNWPTIKISKIRMKFASTGSIKLRCCNTEYENSNYFPETVLFSENATVSSIGWNEWTVNWTLSNANFTVGYFQSNSTDPDLYYDTSSPDKRSYMTIYENSTLTNYLYTDIDWAIQIYVEYNEGNTKNVPLKGKWLDGSISEKELKYGGLLKEIESGSDSTSVNTINLVEEFDKVIDKNVENRVNRDH